MSFTKTAKQVQSTIKAIDPKKVRSQIQAACFEVCAHAMAYGSSPLADALTEKMASVPMLARLAPQVTRLLLAHGPFVFTKGVGFQFSKVKAEKIADEFGIRESFDADAFSESLPAWDDQAKDEAKAKAFDLQKELEALIKRAEGKIVKGECATASLLPYLMAANGQHAAHLLTAKVSAPTADEAKASELIAALKEAGAGVAA